MPLADDLIQDFHFQVTIFHFDHERIPERVVHARRVEGHGFFESNGEPGSVNRAAVWAR